MDWNNDGYSDLIIGEYGVKTGTPTGKVHFFERNSDGTLKSSTHLKCNGEEITIRYTAPTVVDWNNDGLLDLIVGHTDDTINGTANRAPHLYINEGTKEQYQFNSRQLLCDKNGNPIADFYNKRTHVKVVDLNKDGKKDIVMGGWGPSSPGEKFYYYKNVGTDKAPLLETKQELKTNSGSALVTSGSHKNQRFDFWDWNNDGYEDIIWADYKVTKSADTCSYDIYTNPIYISYSSTNGVIDTEEPVVKIIAPNGGEVFQSGDTISLNWNSSDNIGITNEEFEISLDSAKTWQSLIAVRKNGDFLLPSLTSKNAFIRVKAYDKAGNLGVDMSDSAFEIKVKTSLLSNKESGESGLLIKGNVLTVHDSRDFAVELLTLDGRSIYQKDFTEQSTVVLPGNISAGLYIVRVKTEAAMIIQMWLHK